MAVKGKGARGKGYRAERKLRDILRKIYPTSELKHNVQRIPMSGAGYIKGDVADNNDVDSCYEVKNQEQLHLHDWWRQTKSQAGSTRTPVLVVTQNFRPFYFIMMANDWSEMVQHTEYKDYTESTRVHTGSTFFDELADLSEMVCGVVTLDDDECYVISQSFYIDVKTSIYESTVIQ